MIDFIVDLFSEMFAGGDAKAKRARALRRKLIRYVKNAGASAYSGSGEKYLNPAGEIRGDVKSRIINISKKFDNAGTQDWEELLSRFLNAVEKEVPGVIIQLPPDEPRMVYAGDKQL